MRLPTFAVLVDIDRTDAAELAVLATVGRPAVAFVLDPMGEDTIDALRDNGWRCIRLHTIRDIARAWQEATTSMTAGSGNGSRS